MKEIIIHHEKNSYTYYPASKTGDFAPTTLKDSIFAFGGHQQTIDQFTAEMRLHPKQAGGMGRCLPIPSAPGRTGAGGYYRQPPAAAVRCYEHYAEGVFRRFHR